MDISHKILKSILQTAMDGFWLVDLEGRIIDINEAACKMLGYTRKEMVKLSISDLELKETAELTQKHIQQIVENGKDRFESIHRCKNGETIEVELSVKFQSDQDLIVVFVRDITKQKQSEQSLRISEEYFRNIFEHSTVGKSITEIGGDLRTNEAFRQILGYSEEELSNLKWHEITHPDDIARDESHTDSLVSGKNITKRWEKRYIHRDGHVVWVDLSTIIQRDENGNPHYFITTIIDISEQKRVLDALQESEARVHNKLNAILTPEVDLDILQLEDIIDVPAVREIMENIFNLTGITSALLDTQGKMLIEMGFQEICTRYHRAHFEACLNCQESDTILSSKVDPGTFKLYRCKNNLWDLASPIHIGGRHVGNLFIGQFFFKDEVPDIELFKAQAKLFGFNEAEYLLTLERVPRVSRETVNALAGFYTHFSAMISTLSYSSLQFARMLHERDLAEQKILESQDQLSKALNVSNQSRLTLLSVLEDQKIAENDIKKLNEELEQRVIDRTSQLLAANKELEAFSYSVSHDLRAPLRGINGFARILMEDYAPKLDDEGKRVCSIIQDNSQKMGRLIDGLLSFSRLTRVDIQLSEVDMKTMVNSIYYEITDAQSRQKIDLSIGDLCVAHGDPVMLRQVWANLLSNAVKYSSKKVKTKISVTCKKEMQKYIYCVKDSGVGFDMSYSNKLFGVFQRLHSTKDFEGTGVGLAIVQRIILRHGGEVWAEGKLDKGASFYFSLPIQPTN